MYKQLLLVSMVIFDRFSGKTIFCKPRISHIPTLQRCKANFNSRQAFAFKDIYLWRNKLARNEDESENYVLPTHMLIKIRWDIRPGSFKQKCTCLKALNLFQTSCTCFIYVMACWYDSRYRFLTILAKWLWTLRDIRITSYKIIIRNSLDKRVNYLKRHR